MKIERTVWKGTFAEAEEKDNLFWAAQSPEDRLKALVDIRSAIFNGAGNHIEKVVFRRRISEQQEAN